MRRLSLVIAVALATFAASALPGEESVPVVRVNGPSDSLPLGLTLPAEPMVQPLPHADGAPEVSLSSFASESGKPFLVLFWSSKCPVCRRYVPALKALEKDFEGRVKFSLVFPNATETEADAKSWLEAESLAGAAAIDLRREAAARLGAVVTPTVLLFDASGALRYRGPIDDDRRARRRDTTDSLRLALEAVLAGKPVENPEPRAFGSSVRGRRTEQR